MTRRAATAAIAGGLGALRPGLSETPPRRAGWPLWESYVRRFLSEDGRVIDFDADQITTSEGQSYAAFFALVANDRPRFDRILSWTDSNLAAGQLGERLPAWLWGRNDQGKWGVLDENSAADSDVWLAYVLLEAGRLWDDPALAARGRALADTAARLEVRRLRGLGSMLLPGPRGFEPSAGVYQLNPSYLPMQALLCLADAAPDSPWRRVARQTPAVLEGASRHGFILDWVAYRENAGFEDAPLPRPEAKCSYDAIRTYLWAGMLHPLTEQREQTLAPMPGMKNYLQTHEVPPAEVLADGRVADPYGGVGFSAALLPYLSAHAMRPEAEAQRRRVEGAFVRDTGLYDEPPRYYHQNLILFGLGWAEGRFSFGPRGALRIQEVS
jgi:endoglucanase